MTPEEKAALELAKTANATPENDAPATEPKTPAQEGSASESKGSSVKPDFVKPVQEDIHLHITAIGSRNEGTKDEVFIVSGVTPLNEKRTIFINAKYAAKLVGVFMVDGFVIITMEKTIAGKTEFLYQDENDMWHKGTHGVNVATGEVTHAPGTVSTRFANALKTSQSIFDRELQMMDRRAKAAKEAAQPEVLPIDAQYKKLKEAGMDDGMIQFVLGQMIAR